MWQALGLDDMHAGSVDATPTSYFMGTTCHADGVFKNPNNASKAAYHPIIGLQGSCSHRFIVIILISGMLGGSSRPVCQRDTASISGITCVHLGFTAQNHFDCDS